MSDRRELRVLSRAESIDLLATAWIGRVILTANALPTALPVNYALDGDAIVFRSAEGVKLSAGEAGTVVAFEVDHFDAQLRMGWSVLATGLARRLSDPVEVRRAQDLGVPTWVEPGPHDGYVRIDIGSVTGRRLVPLAHGPASAPLAS
jgi:uncharacterized protein